jgi:hypothetical protein
VEDDDVVASMRRGREEVAVVAAAAWVGVATATTRRAGRLRRRRRLGRHRRRRRCWSFVVGIVFFKGEEEEEGARGKLTNGGEKGKVGCGTKFDPRPFSLCVCSATDDKGSREESRGCWVSGGRARALLLPREHRSAALHCLSPAAAASARVADTLV